MQLKFRTLKENEIDCRIGTINQKGLSLLLYKDARVDMDLLDEVVGATNWQRSHSRDNANCIVSIWDDEKKQWVSKEDVGSPSNTEAAKGLASDSFKRACVNWGIGRELYTAPFIWITDANITTNKSGNPACYDKFVVRHIEYNADREIVGLSIINEKSGKVVYNMNSFVPKNEPKKPSNPTDEQIAEVKELLEKTNSDVKAFCKWLGIKSVDEMNGEQYVKAMQQIEAKMRTQGEG